MVSVTNKKITLQAIYLMIRMVSEINQNITLWSRGKEVNDKIVTEIKSKHYTR